MQEDLVQKPKASFTTPDALAGFKWQCSVCTLDLSLMYA